MRIVLMAMLLSPWMVGCAGEDEESAAEDECYTNDDCPDDQVCVISHDHEGDDHDHGGDCEEPE